MNPMPLREDMVRAYKSYYTHSDSRAPSCWKRFWTAVKCGYLRSRYGYRKGVGPKWYGLLWLFAYLHWYGIIASRDEATYLPAPSEGVKLLEIGFGGAVMLERMSSMGWDAYGIDSDPVAVNRAAAMGLNVSLGELSDQHYESESFDCIVMRHVLEHVCDPVEFMQECFRVLKPYGTLVAILPNAAGWGHKLFGSNWVHLDPPRHLFAYGPAALRRIIKDAGLTVEKLFTTVIGAFEVWRVSIEIASPDHRLLQRLMRKLGMIIYQVAARVRLLLEPLSGDEMVVVAKKQQ